MKKILIIALVGLFLTACGAKNTELTRYSDTSLNSGFDTVMELIAYTNSKEEFDGYFETLKNEFVRYNELFDKYHTYPNINNIKTINDFAGIEPVKVDPAIIDMLLEAKKYTEINDMFDVTLGAMLKIWHNYREEGIVLNDEGKPGAIPTIAELESAMELTGWDFVELDTTNNTVFLTKKGMELDVGAIAKGYATEMVARKLEADGLEHAIVSGGGNIRTINTKPDNVSWAVGIQEPSRVNLPVNIDILSIPYSVSIVTSGDYQRAYYGPDEVMYSHLINPKTLFPATYFRSATIVTPDSTMADALSTVLFMLPYEEGLQFANDFNARYPDKAIGVFWIVDKEESWYHSEKFDYMMTDNLKQYSKNLSQ